VNLRSDIDEAPGRPEGHGVPPGHDWLRLESRPKEQARGKEGDDHGAAPNDGTQEAGEEESRSALDVIRAHPWVTGVVALLLLAAIVAGVTWWLATRDYESSDDAFIDARTVFVSTQVGGNVVAVPVTDNQHVEPGTPLARIDDRDYRAAVDQAKASVDQAEAAMATADAQISAQQEQIDQTAKQITEAQAALNFAKDENKRYQDLVKQGAGTAQRAQQAASDLQQKQAAYDVARAANVQAKKQVAVLEAQRRSASAQREQALAQLDRAKADLSRTRLTSTVAGRVTKLTAAVGAFATPGQTLMMVVPDEVWVTANFKETQLASMRPGQPADIEVDAYGRSFKGHVDSIQAGSGTAFSLLPAENATGNYVKVVQRVPVKIVFDKRPDVELGPGMSVVPSVKVR
jgi:membrane fusion protein (multidrug efflux system)